MYGLDAPEVLAGEGCRDCKLVRRGRRRPIWQLPAQSTNDQPSHPVPRWVPVTQYPHIRDQIDDTKASAGRLTLTEHGVELPAPLRGTTDPVTVVTPTAVRTVLPLGPGLSETAHLLWRYPTPPETLSDTDLSAGTILLGTRATELRRYTIRDERSAPSLDLALHNPDTQPYVGEGGEYEHSLRIISLRVQAIKATLHHTAWVGTETRQALQADCEALHRLCTQQRRTIPGVLDDVHDHELFWNEQLTDLGRITTQFRALRTTHRLAKNKLANDPFGLGRVTDTLATLLTKSHERCVKAHNRWTNATQPATDTATTNTFHTDTTTELPDDEWLDVPPFDTEAGDRDGE